MGKTHCKHGHEYTPENTAIWDEGYRRCRECSRIRRQAARQRARERKLQGVEPPRRGNPKLTAAQVQEIRARFAAGTARPHELAKEYDVYQSTIAHILAGRTWNQELES